VPDRIPPPPGSRSSGAVPRNRSAVGRQGGSRLEPSPDAGSSAPFKAATAILVETFSRKLPRRSRRRGWRAKAGAASPPLPSARLSDLAPAVRVPPDGWQTKQDFLLLNLADLDLRTLRRGSPLTPLFKVVRLVLRGRLDLADRILKHVDARTQAEVKKWIFFREGKTLAPVTEEEIMQEISVASILDRQRTMHLQEGEEKGRQETLAKWLESRFGSAAGRSLSRLVGRDPGADKLSRVAEILAEAATFEEFWRQVQRL